MFSQSLFSACILFFLAAFVAAEPIEKRQNVGSIFNSITSDAGSVFSQATSGAASVFSDATSGAASVGSDITSAGGQFATDVTSVAGHAETIITSVGGQAFTLASNGIGSAITLGGSVYTVATAAATDVGNSNGAMSLSSGHVFSVAAFFASMLFGAWIVL